jgi:hypothetical protein
MEGQQPQGSRRGVHALDCSGIALDHSSGNPEYGVRFDVYYVRYHQKIRKNWGEFR